MTMYYKTYLARAVSPQSATNNIIVGFTRQLNQWWINYLSEQERNSITNTENVMIMETL